MFGAIVRHSRGVLREQGFEVRAQEPHIIVETDFEDAGSKAFGRLFDYISGNNQSRTGIDMTSPVEQKALGKKIDMNAPVGQQRSNNS